MERPFRLQLPGARDLIGYLDLQEATTIRDLKVSGKSPSRNAAVESLQLAAYGLAAEVLDGVRPEAVALDHVVRLKRGPKIATVAATVGPETNAWVLARWRAADAQIKSGVLPPATPGSWWCSAKWCGYHDRCPYGAPQRVSIDLPSVRPPGPAGGESFPGQDPSEPVQVASSSTPLMDAIHAASPLTESDWT